jgi:transposase
MLVHGKEYLCVLGYSACFASEQLHSISTTLTKMTENLRRLAGELSKPQARFTEQGIRNKIGRWLSDSFVREVLHYELEQRENKWHLSFQVDHQTLQQLWSQRLGRTVLLTNRLDWTAEQVVAGYSGQQQIERVFRGLKDGEWLGWGPMYHWTDSKIRIHAFYCMLGISLLQYLHRESRKVWPGLSVEQFLGGTPPDSAVRPPLPTTRRQGTQSGGHSAIQADPCSTSSCRIAWTGTAL